MDSVVPFCTPSCASKHSRHSTGRPSLGRKGTEVSCPQAAQVVTVSGRALVLPLPRLALHGLQCAGSLVKLLLLKNTCSPAVKIKSAPQSLHFSVLSAYSMTGVPWEVRNDGFGVALKKVPTQHPWPRFVNS